MTALRRRTRYPWKTAAIATLAAGGTIAEAAAVAHVSPRSINRWNANPKFREQVQAARDELLSRALGTAADLAVAAVSTLAQVMNDADAPSAARVSAAKAALEHLLRGREASVIGDRIGRLEEALNQKQGMPVLLAPREVQR